MAYPYSMYIGYASHQLIRVKLYEQRRNHLLHLYVLLHDSVKRVWNEVHHNIQIDLIGLVSISIEELSHLNAIGMMKSLQNLKLSVLISFVLEDFLNSYCFSSLSDGCLEYNAK